MPVINNRQIIDKRNWQVFLMFRFLFDLATILDDHNTFSDILNNSLNLFKEVMGT